MVSVLVITIGFPSIDSSNTSPMLTDHCQIPKHFNGFTANLIPETKA
jgi:hypothetical protein